MSVAANSEARKREQEAEERRRDEHAWVERTELRWRERRREVVRDALAGVYSGAGFAEADALLDQLDTLGARVEVGQ